MESWKGMSSQHSDTTQVTFDDVAAYFSQEEWKLLLEWQKELYRNVMKEIHQALVSLGPRIATSIFSLKAKETDGPYPVSHEHFERQPASNHNTSAVDSREQLICTTRSVADPWAVSVNVVNSFTGQDSHTAKNESMEETSTEEDDEVVILTVKEEKGIHSMNHTDCERESGKCHIGLQKMQRKCEAEDSSKSLEKPTKNKSSLRKHNENKPWNSDIYVRNQVCLESIMDKHTGQTHCLHASGSSTSPQLNFHQDNPIIKELENNDCESTLENSELFRSPSNMKQHCGPYTYKTCEQIGGLKVNIISHPIMDKEEKPYQCTKCEKRFGRKRNLIRHQKTHEELRERPYKCDECQKAFSEKCNLVLHNRTHTGERPYQCTECKKRFRLKPHLINHQRLHSGEKPYKCAECEKCFGRKSQLMVHMAKHTR